MLEKLVNKKYIVYTSRGNESIKLVFKFLKEKKIKTILMQDQGGWITYSQFAKKLKLDIKKIKTDFGIIKKIPKKKQSALIINSLTGYTAQQPMKKIAKDCKKNKIVLINDVSGSIGTEIAKYGDFILGSFGKNKPLSIGKGGFIATDDHKAFAYFINKKKNYNFNINLLNKKLVEFKKRIKKLYDKNKKIKKDLSKFKILHKKSKGINVIIAYNKVKEKEKIIEYCKKNKLPYKECPMNIKVETKAISIEVQNL